MHSAWPDLEDSEELLDLHPPSFVPDVPRILCLFLKLVYTRYPSLQHDLRNKIKFENHDAWVLTVNSNVPNGSLFDVASSNSFFF